MKNDKEINRIILRKRKRRIKTGLKRYGSIGGNERKCERKIQESDRMKDRKKYDG